MDEPAPVRRNVILVGGSSGGLMAVRELVSYLPRDLMGAVFVVIHVAADADSRLPHILASASSLAAHHAEDGMPIRQGHIYVAPPDRHLVLGEDRMQLSSGPRENSSRPAIDVLFRSAARAHGERVAGVILSGTLDDGSAGLLEVKRQGGLAIVQEPQEASFPEMPLNAIEVARPHCVARLAQVSRILDRAARGESVPCDGPASASEAAGDEAGVGSSGFGLVCPECGGPLHAPDASSDRFHCEVGHAYALQSLIAAHGLTLEQTLWAALRALRQEARLAEQGAQRAVRSGHPLAAKRFQRRQVTADTHVEILERLLHDHRRDLTAAEDTAPWQAEDVAEGSDS